MSEPFLNQTNFSNISPLGGGKYEFIYNESLSFENGICLTGNENTALTINLINVKLEGNLVIDKVKSLTIILKDSEIIGDIYADNCNYLSGSIELDEKSKLCGYVNFNEVHFTRFHFINLKVSKSVTFSKENKAIRKITEITENKEIQDKTENGSTIIIKDIKTIEERKDINESTGQIKNLNFSGKGRIGEDLVFSGGSLTDMNIKGLDIHRDFKIGYSAEISGVISYCGYKDVNKTKPFIGGNFELDQSVRYNLKSDNIISTSDGTGDKVKKIVFPVIQFERAEIHGKLLIDQLTLAAKFRMRHCEIMLTQFLVNTTFLDLADFYGTTFKKPINFFKCNFEGPTVFSDAVLEGNLLFTFSEFKSHLIFRETKFLNHSGLDLATSIITSNVYFQHVKMGYFDISREDISDASRGNGDKGQISAKNRRDTFRIIKKYAKDNDDSYEYNHFGYLEARAATTMFRWQFWLPWRAGKWPFQDYLIHSLNRWSNNHKKHWLQALLFTVGMVVISLMLVVFACHEDLSPLFQERRDEYVSLGLKLINPLHRLDIYSDLYPDYGMEPRLLAADLFSRIFVGYGYYQFVQAFRRFK